MPDNDPFQFRFAASAAAHLRQASDLIRGATGKVRMALEDAAGEEAQSAAKYKPLHDVIEQLERNQDSLRELLRQANDQALRRESGADQ